MTSNLPDVSERLTHAFASWQLYYFGYELEVARLYAEGLATKQDRIDAQRGNQLADTILDNSIGDLVPDEWRPRKEIVSEQVLCGRHLLNYYDSFPRELFAWNRKSRRAFHLPISLEVMLASATFPEMQWDDVLWPHESFVISLDRPLHVLHPRGVDQSFDTIMVSKVQNKDGDYSVHLRWFQVPPKSGPVQGFSIKEAKQFRASLKKNDLVRALNLWSRVGKAMQKFAPYIPGSQFATIDIGATGFSGIVTEPAELYEKLGDISIPWEKQSQSNVSYFECLSVTLRIAVGWMMYLETLSRESIKTRSDDQKRLRTIAGGAPAIITTPDAICEIVGKGRIDPSEITSEPAQRCTKGFVRPHWRRAHYRRPVGSLPNAPKSQRIPPVLVRADLVPLYGIIGGTTTIVIPEE